jgi:hypothetical protein
LVYTWRRYLWRINGEDRVKVVEVGKESKAVCTMAGTSFDEKGA